MAEKIKLMHKDKKAIIYNEMQLGKKAFLDLREGKRTAYDLEPRDFNKPQAHLKKVLYDGYKILYRHEGKDYLVLYNK